MPIYDVEMSVPASWSGWADLRFPNIEAATPEEAISLVMDDYDEEGFLDWEIVDHQFNHSDYGVSESAVDIRANEVKP